MTHTHTHFEVPITYDFLEGLPFPFRKEIAIFYVYIHSDKVKINYDVEF